MTLLQTHLLRLVVVPLFLAAMTSPTIGQVLTFKRTVASAFDRPEVEQMLDGRALQYLIREHYENLGETDVDSGVVVTPDSRLALFVTGWELRVWDLTTGVELRRMNLHPDGDRNDGHGPAGDWQLKLSPDGALVVTSSYDSRVPLQIWQIEQGEEIHRVKRTRDANRPWECAFSQDGSSLAVESLLDHRLEIYDTKSWRVTQTLPAPETEVYGFSHLVFSNDGQSILCLSGVYENYHLVSWDLQAGRVRTIPYDALFGAESVLRAFAETHDSQWATVHANEAEQQIEVILWDQIGGRKLRVWQTEKNPVSNLWHLSTVDIESDGKRILISTNQTVNGGLNGIVLDRETGDVQGLTGASHATFLPDGKHVIGVASERVEIWSLESQKPVVRLVPLSEPRHYATLAMGSAFAVDPETLKILQAHDESKLRYDFQATEKNFETPAQWLEACHQPEVVSRHLTSIITRPSTQPASTLTSSPNDSAIKRQLFFLGVGVAKHKYEEYNLDFCDCDVTAIADVLKSQQGKVVGRVHVQLYTNEQATRDNLEAGLNWIAEGCRPEDTAIIMFAGHGLRARRGLYFLPYDGDTESLAASCLNWDTVGSTLARCRAHRTLFLSDACHAGAFGVSQLPLQEDIVKSLSKAEGVMLLASSADREESYELSELRHGAFTASLLEGLSGRADVDQDGQISLGELADDAIEQVPRLTSRMQHPSIPELGHFDRELVIAHSVSKPLQSPQVPSAEPIPNRSGESPAP